MPTLQKFYCTVKDIHSGVHNFGSHSLKIMLTNTAPSLTNTVKSNITEISAGNGYSAGGAGITVTSADQSLGLYTVIANDVTWSASGGSIGPFRWAVIYNDTPTSPADPLLFFLDYQYAITVASGQDFVVDFDSVSGVYFAS